MSAVLAEVVERAPIVVLSAVADLVRGVSYPKTDAREEPAPGFVPVLRATNIQEASLVLDSDLVFVAERNVSSDQLLRPGDIVVATSSGSKRLVGKSGQLHALWRGSFGAFCATIRPRPGVHPRYLALFLQAPAYWSQVTKKALGVNINNLRRGDLGSLELPLPSLTVQTSIVAEIEKQFSRLDEAVANLKRARRNINAMRRAVLDAAALGRLPIQSAQDELAGQDIASHVMAARRRKWAGARKYKEPVAPDPELPLNVPRHWATLSWEAILLPEDGAFKRGPFGSSLTKAMFVDQGYKVFEQYCPINDDCSFARYYIDATKFEEMKDFAVRAGDFLISCSGVTLGRITRVPRDFEPGIINQALLRVRVDPEVVEPAFFQIVFRSPTFQGFLFERSAGAAIPNLRGVGQLKAIPVPVPPLSEQRQVIAEVERRFSIVRQVEAEVDANLERATALRGSVLARAFS